MLSASISGLDSAQPPERRHETAVGGEMEQIDRTRLALGFPVWKPSPIIHDALAADRGAANAQFEEASMYTLSFPDASFDAVFC
jgi:hypothetical protein